MARGSTRGVKRKKLSPRELDQKVFEHLQANPGHKSSDVASEIGIGQLEVRESLTRLEDRNAVRREGKTRATRWYLVDGVGLDDVLGGDLPPEPEEAPRRRGRPPGSGSKAAALDAVRDEIGKVADAEIAERVGVSVATVANYRKRNGIAPFAGRGRKPAAAAPESDERAEAPARREAAAPRRRADRDGEPSVWRVEVKVKNDVVIRYVVAADLEGAANAGGNGARGLGGRAVSISWVGPTFA